MNALIQRWNETLSRKQDQWALHCCSSNEKLSFAALDARSKILRQRLLSELHTGRRRNIFAFQVADRIEWMAAFLASAMVDAIAFPIDTTYPPSEVERVLEVYNATLFYDGALFRKGRAHNQTRRFSKDTGLVKLTSGSSSAPKAIPFSHAQMISDAETIIRTMKILPEDVHYATIPLGHSYGLGSLVYPLFVHGIRLSSIPCRFLHYWSGNSRYRRIRDATIPPLSGNGDASEPASGKLRLVISAASKLTPKSPIRSIIEPDFGWIISTVHARPGNRIRFPRLADLASALSESHARVKVWITRSGRVSVSSERLNLGNHRRDPDSGCGIHLMPDRGTIRDGMLTLTGRSNRIAKHNGKRINLEQIERILTEHPAIRESYVIYDEGNHRLMAALACDSLPENFPDWMSNRMPAWQRPKYIHTTAALPHNDRGKPDKARIAHSL